MIHIQTEGAETYSALVGIQPDEKKLFFMALLNVSAKSTVKLVRNAHKLLIFLVTLDKETAIISFKEEMAKHSFLMAPINDTQTQ